MKRVLLIEPNYKNKYPPMGLMKLATYYRNRGDEVRFYKGDLRDFAATLLCEEFIVETEDFGLVKYWLQFFQYLKTRKNAPIETIEGFFETDYYELLRLYRKRYNERNYPKFDVVCVTTLFTFHWRLTIDTINFCKHFLENGGRLLVGGVASSLQSEKLFEETGIRPLIGLMNQKGSIDGDCDVIIDELPLDYSILEEIDYKYPSNDAYFAYMTRGCPNKCPFCAVPKLEPEYQDYVCLKPQIDMVDKCFGKRKDLLLMDNNVFASKKFAEIIDEIKLCGFERGASYVPPSKYDVAFQNITAKKSENRNTRAYIKAMIAIYDRITVKLPTDDERAIFYEKRKDAGLLHYVSASKCAVQKFDGIARPLYDKFFRSIPRSRYIDFNQGLDSRRITEEKIKKLSEINIRPLRIAFDKYTPQMIENYTNAITLAKKYGLTDLSNYLLYNHEDKPEELYHRLKHNIDLCDELNITIYSFPMKFHPVDDPEYFCNRDFVGEHWNRKFIRAVQAVLNSTKGKIGRGKSFFEEAFGRDVNEFMKILWMPETFIIYRRRYDRNLRERLKNRYPIDLTNASDLANEWWDCFTSLPKEKATLLKDIVAINNFNESVYEKVDNDIINVLNYYKTKRH